MSSARPSRFGGSGQPARLQLNDGFSIPAIGLGTAPLDNDESAEAVADGIEIGYRLIDTGAIYGNEQGVGRGIRKAALPRDELLVMTKVRGRDQGYDETLRALQESLSRLDLEYVDLYLIHWPNPQVDRFVDTWRALIHLRDEGLVRTIGVSNFTHKHIDRLIQATGVAPAVDQIEVHPGWYQPALRARLADRAVQVVCYSPLGRGGDLLDNRALVDLATAHDVSVAQLVLRWHVDQGMVPLPRASAPARRRENFGIFDFSLTTGEIARISDAITQQRTGFDPETHEEL